MSCNPRIVTLTEVDLSSANIRTFQLLAQLENQRVLEQYKCISLKYGQTDDEKLDVYYKDTSVATPIVVYIHYAGGAGLTKESSTFHVAPVVEKGYRAMVVNLDYLANVTMPEEKQEHIKKVRAFILKYARKTFAKIFRSQLSNREGGTLIFCVISCAILEAKNAEPVKKQLTSAKSPAKSPVQPSPSSSPAIPSPVIKATSAALLNKSPSPKEVISLESDGTPPEENKRKSDEGKETPRKRIKPTLLSATIDREKFNAESPTICFDDNNEATSAAENEKDIATIKKVKDSNENETSEKSAEEGSGDQKAAENPDEESTNREEIDENPLTVNFKALLDACRKADPSDDMNTLIEKKLLKYYHAVHPDFVTSKGFSKTVKAVCEQIEATPELVYYQLKTVVEELKVRRKSKATVMSNEDVASTGNERRDRQIRLLSKGLLSLTKRIEKLEEADVDLGDEDNSAYLQLERLKKHACKIYDKICDLTGESKHAHRAVKKPVTFQGTAYPQFNRTLQAFVNRTHTFPDFFDVLRCLEHCNAQYGLGLRNDDMKKIAQDAFLKIGKLLQNRRKADLYETVAHFTGTAPDPALADETLSDKLTENQKYHAKIGSIIDRFAKEQEMAAAETKDNKTKTKGDQPKHKNQQPDGGDTAQETDSHVTSNGKVNSASDNIEENKSNPATPKDSTSDKENESNAESKGDSKSPEAENVVVPVEEIVISDEDDS